MEFLTSTELVPDLNFGFGFEVQDSSICQLFRALDASFKYIDAFISCPHPALLAASPCFCGEKAGVPNELIFRTASAFGVDPAQASFTGRGDARFPGAHRLPQSTP